MRCAPNYALHNVFAYCWSCSAWSGPTFSPSTNPYSRFDRNLYIYVPNALLGAPPRKPQVQVHDYNVYIALTLYTVFIAKNHCTNTILYIYWLRLGRINANHIHLRIENQIIRERFNCLRIIYLNADSKLAQDWFYDQLCADGLTRMRCNVFNINVYINTYSTYLFI